MEKDSKDAIITKLSSDLRLLEQELTQMANRLGGLNQQVNNEQLKNKKLKDDMSTFKSRLEAREKQISQEIADKRILMDKINKIEKENIKFKKILLLNKIKIPDTISRISDKKLPENEEKNELPEEIHERKSSLTDQINYSIENVFK